MYVGLSKKEKRYDNDMFWKKNRSSEKVDNSRELAETELTTGCFNGKRNQFSGCELLPEIASVLYHMEKFLANEKLWKPVLILSPYS